MRTVISASIRRLVAVQVRQSLQFRARLWTGRVLARSGLVRRALEYQSVYADWDGMRELGALSEEEIERVRAFQVGKVGKDSGERSGLRIDAETLGTGRATMYQRAASAVIEVLSVHPEIHSVANVGARVDVVCSYLAQVYPGIEFVSVDFQKELAEHNRALAQSPNWKFRSGYALEMFERGELQPDLVLFSSTSVLFRNRELRRYVEAMSRFAKFLVFNEPWFAPLEGGRAIIRPEQIDPYRSMIGGRYCNYLHNYVAILEEHGFDVLRSEILGDTHEAFLRLKLIARNSRAGAAAAS